VIATGGTQRYLADAGLPVERVNKVAEGRPHIVDKIIDGDRADLQHHRGLAEPEGLAVDPRVGADRQGSVLHHGGRIGGCGRRLRQCKIAKLEVRSLQDYYS
jgi:carbamoyl-phosphate synthase large subunit